MNRWKINYERWLKALFILLIFVFCLWSIGGLDRVKVVSDEFAYWGIAASFAGYDWHDLMAATGYYSFGYSMVLTPLMLLGRLGVSMALLYKLAIILNACFMAGQYMLTVYVMKELDLPLSGPARDTVGFFLTLYVGSTAQMDIAWTEVYLVFMFWCIIALLLRTIRKHDYLDMLLLIAASAHIFMIHMRAVGVVIAVAVVLAAWIAGHHRELGIRYIGFTAGMSAVFVVITAALKKYVSDYIYGGNNADSVNDIAANVTKARSLVSLRGGIDFVLSALGKLYYAGTASFVLALVGMTVAVCLLVKALYLRIKRRQDTKWQLREWMLLFVLLAFLGETGVSAIFKSFRYYSQGVTSVQPDSIVFGRYSDFVIGPMMFLGIWAVYRITVYYKEIIVGILFFGICTVCVQKQFDILVFYNDLDNLGLRGTAVPWLGAFHYDQIGFFAYYAAGISIMVFLCICLIRTVDARRFLSLGIALTGIAVFWGVFGVKGSLSYTESKSNKVKTVVSVQNIIDAAGKDSSVYLVLNAGAPVDAKILQWCMGTQSIHMLKPEDIENVDLSRGIFLADSGDVRTVGVMSDRMDYIYDSGTIAVFAADDNAQYDQIAFAASEMSHTVNPVTSGVDLAQVMTELSYQKDNGSLYYNYQASDGGYLTYGMGVLLEDGVYEFDVDLRVLDVTPGNDAGYITVGTSAGDIQSTYVLRADDFMEKERQTVSLAVSVRDWQEPVIGIYTYGEASFRVYGISYHKTEGNIALNTEEWDDIAAWLQNAPDRRPVYYVDSDDSANTGFPGWQGNDMRYLSGAILPYKEIFGQGYYVVEKTDPEVTDLCLANMTSVLETQRYTVMKTGE